MALNTGEGGVVEQSIDASEPRNARSDSLCFSGGSLRFSSANVSEDSLSRGSVSTYDSCSTLTSLQLLGEDPTASGSLEDRMQRWQERRNKRNRRREENTAFTYGKLTLAQVQSNHTTTSLQDMLEGKGLRISGLEPIGSGTYARVYKGSWDRSCGVGSMPPTASAPSQEMPVAVKIIRGRQSQSDAEIPPTWLEREVQASRQHKHPNLVQVFEVSITRAPYVLVLEYCAGGNLHDLLLGITKHGTTGAAVKLTWRQKMKVALDVATGMAHLHASRVVHRDLKALNILLASRVESMEIEPHAKVCDFGLARYLEKASEGELVVAYEELQADAEPDKEFLTRDVGSLHFMAPEMFSCSSPQHARYDEKIDVYSYAMLLYELMAQRTPLAGINLIGQLGTFVADGGRPPEDDVSEDAPQVLRELMRRAWAKEPADRPSFVAILAELQEAYANTLTG